MLLIILEGFDNIPSIQVNVAINSPSDLSQLCCKLLLGSCTRNFFRTSRCILDSESTIAKVSVDETRARDTARIDDDHGDVVEVSNSLEKSSELLFDK